MPIRVTGSFKNIDKFFNTITGGRYYRHILEKYGEKGVQALQTATPSNSGITAASWMYEVKEGDGIYTITWLNTNVNKHINIAIILDTGHGTRNGGYVMGRHYIEPAIQPIFDQMAEDVWREVTRA